MLTPAAAIASLIKTPVPHGFGLSAMPDGSMTKRIHGFPFSFKFSFGGRPFEAIAHDHDDKVHIRAETVLGVLPYSHEDRQRRNDIMRVLTATGEMGNPRATWFGIGWYIGPGQRIHLGVGLDVEPSAAPVSVLADIIFKLLPARGWIGLMDGLCHPPAPVSVPAGHNNLPVPA